VKTKFKKKNWKQNSNEIENKIHQMNFKQN
jgi:hypothetical protein